MRRDLGALACAHTGIGPTGTCNLTTMGSGGFGSVPEGEAMRCAVSVGCDGPCLARGAHAGG